jgi:hypothetical protein
LYHGTSTAAQNFTYTVPAGSNSRRILVIAIASSRTDVGARSVTLTYGGQTLIPVNGDMALATQRHHTQLYYLNEAGLDAATNSTLAVTVSGASTRATDVFASVYDNIDQNNPVTDSRTYTSGTSNTTNPLFSPALTVNASDLAVEVISCFRVNSTSLRNITYAANWSMVNQQTTASTDAVRNAVAYRSVPVTNTTDASSTTFSGNALGSMTAMSLKEAPRYFLSAASGNWNSTSTWQESYDNATWQPATEVPTNISLLTTIQSGHTVTLTAAAAATDLTIEGVLDVSTFTLTGSGNLNVSSTGDLLIGGASNFPAGFPSTTLSSGSTVNYDNAGSQNVATFAYSNLILSISGAKSISTGTSVAGNLSISGATASVGAGLNIAVGSLTLGGINRINGTWGSTTATSATYHDNTYFSATTGYLTVSTDTRTSPDLVVSTASQSICSGFSSITLSGTVSAGGPLYPTNGETVAVTINGITQNASISGGAGGFSINYTTSAIPANGTPYTITYAYAGNTILAAASNTGTTLTVNSTIGNNFPDFAYGAHGTICGTAIENGNATLTAPSGTVFINVGFSSYGTPGGSCLSYTLSSCNSLTSQSVTEGYLLGNNTATIPATNAVFGDPCVGTQKRLYVQATYTEPVCAGVAPGTITGSLPSGGNGVYTYLWESSTTSSSTGFSAAAGTNDLQDYTPGVLSQSTWYRRTVYSGGCANSISPVILIKITPVIAGNAVSSAQTICTGSSPAALSGTIPTGGSGTFVYLWESSTTSAATGFSAATGTNNTQNYSPAALTQTTWYRRTVTSGGCSSTSTAIQVTVNVASVGGTVASAQTICSGTSPADLTLSGNTGSVVRWEKSTNAAFTALTIIAGTTTTLSSATIGSLTANTYFRAVVQGGTCAEANSASALITVKPTPTATISGTATVCQNAASPNITFTNPQTLPVTVTYNINGANQTTINVGASTTANLAGLTTTTGTFVYNLVSVVYQSAPTCSNSITGSATVTVAATVGTPVFASGATSTRCQGAGTLTYTATAANSTSVTYALDATSIAGGNSIVAGTGVVTYAAGWSGTSVITASAAGCNGPTTASHTVTVTPTVGTPSFTLGATSSRCKGAGTVTYTATATNNTGLTYSLDATSVTGGNSIAAGTGVVTYAAGWSGTSTITVSAAGCGGPKTATHAVTISPTSVGGTLASAQTICSGTSPSDLTLSGNTGSVVRWEKATDVAFASPTTIAGTTTTLSSATIGTLSANTYFRAVVQSGTCAEAGSSTVLITVRPTPTATISGTTTVCQNATSPNITFTNPQTLPVTVTYNINGANQTTINVGAGTTATLAAPTTTAGTFVYNLVSVVYQTAPTCSSSITGSATVTVTATVGTPVFTLGSTSSRCKGAGTVTYTATAANNTSLTYSLDATSVTGGNSIVAGTGVVTYAAGWSGTSTITVSAAGCGGPVTASHTVTINPTSVGGAIASAQTICSGSSPADLILSGNTGSVVRWEKSTDAAFPTPTTISGTTTTLSGATIGSLSANTYFRAIVKSGTCAEAGSATVLITVRPTPTATISGTTAVCQNATSPNITFTNPQTLPVTVTYNINGANQTTINVGASTAATLAAPTTTAGTFVYNLLSVVYQTAPTCSSSITGSATVSVSATVGTPVFASGATSTRCQGAGSVTYAATASGSTGITYSLDATSIAGGNSIVAGTGVVTYVAGWSGTSIITVSAAGCNGPTTSTHTVTITPTVGTPVFTLGSTSTRCQGAGTVTYTATANNSTSLNYSLDASSTAGGNSIAFSTGVITYVAGWSGTSIITVSAAGCNGPKTATHTVTITPTVGTPVFSSGATSTRCQGAGTVTYTATATNNSGLMYSLDATSTTGGNSIVSGTGAVTFVAGWSGTSIITVSAAGCSGPKTATHTVTINPASVGGTLASAQSICAATSPADLTLTGNTGSVLHWQKSSDLSFTTPTDIPGTTTTLLGATIGSLAANTYFRAVVQSGVCPEAYSSTVLITVKPAPTATISGTTTVCQNTTSPNITFTNPQTLPVTVTYNINGANQTTINVGASTSATLAIPTTTAGTYIYNLVSVAYQTAPACSNTITGSATITVSATVGTPTVITISAGSEPTCQPTNGTTTTTYATTASSSTGFNWTLSNGSAGSIGATTGVMTWALGFSGSVNIQVTANGCNGPSSQVVRTVTINPTVGSPSTPTPSATTICQGSSNTTYTTTATNATSYSWTVSGTGNTISGTGTTGTVTWSPAFSGTATVSVTANGCNGPSAAASTTVTVSATSVSPTLGSSSPVAGSVICSGYNSGSATFTGGSGSGANEYQYSIDGGLNWATYTNSATITTTGGVTSVQVRARRSGGVCAAAAYNTFTIWTYGVAPVSPTLNSASPIGGTTICAGFNTGIVTGTGGSGGSTGATNEYQVSINGGSTYGAYTSGAAVITTGATGSIIVQARRNGGSYGCSSTAWTTINTWNLSSATVNPSLNVATPANGTSFCAGFSPSATITAGSGGSTGSVDTYQYSIDNGSNWLVYVSGTAIATAGATGNVLIRASRSAGSYGCSATGPATIVTWPVSQTPVAPTLGSAVPADGSVICPAFNTGTVTGSAGSGGSGTAADEYQVSIDGGTTFSSYTSGASITTTGATGSVIVQARRTGGSVCANTSWSTICTWVVSSPTIIPALDVATPASGTAICAGFSVSATITAGSGGSAGAADLYEYSINNGVAWLAYTSGASINTATATGNVLIRVSRSAGSYGCSSTGPSIIATWPVSSATVNPVLLAATPANGISICPGYSVSATITPGSGGSAGAADYYDYSIDNGASWFVYVSGSAINTTTATGNVLIRTSRSAGSSGCSATGPAVIVNWPVSSATVSPTLGSANPANGSVICTGFNTGSVNGTGGTGGSTGAANEYQVSINGGGAFSAYTSGAAINTAGASGSVIVQARRTGGSYGCTSTSWATICAWTIGTTPLAPSLGSASPGNGSSICAGFNTGTVTGTGGSGGSSGAANEYQVSIGGAYTAYVSGTAINTFGATGNVIVQARRTGGSYGCSSTAWVTICTWSVSSATVNPILNVATPASGSTICEGYSTSATITAGSGGSIGAADTYEYSINSGVTWFTYTSGSSINTTGATGNVMIRASRSGGSYGCSGSGPATIATWPVASAAVAPTLGSASPASGSTICAGSNTGTVTATGGSGGSSGSANEYQFSINNGASYNSYVNGAAISTTGATGSVIVQARRTGGSYGCSSTSWTTLCTWTVNPQPTITLGSNPVLNRGTTIANLLYSATTSSPNQYSIDYNATANTAGFIDVANAALTASPIVLVVPAAPALATYNAILTVRNSTTGCVSINYPITVTVGQNILTASLLNSSQKSVKETGTMVVTVQLSAVSASQVTVPFTINGGSTATGGGTDYAVTASPLTIAAGSTTAGIVITITSEALDENDETVIVNLGTPTNAILGPIITHTATITDDDPYPTGSIAVNRAGISTDATSLVNGVLLKGCVTASNVVFRGNAAQIGHFLKGSSAFPLSEGVLLSTGNVANAEGPNKDFGTTTQYAGAGDANINTITGGTSYDAAVLEFDFVPAGNILQFNYVFASEEYAEYVGAASNDAFAFLLSGPGITGTVNIALIPSTSTPVSINTVHGQGNTLGTTFPAELLNLMPYPTNFGQPWTRVTDDAIGAFGTAPSRYYYRITPTNNNTYPPLNASYYVDNGQFYDRNLFATSGRKQLEYVNGNGVSDMEFDGRTTVLTASHSVTACQTYHIKMVVADVSDQKWDSGVFLEAKSFSSNEILISSHIGAIIGEADNMFEGCDGSFIRFQRTTGADNSQPFTFPILISGTAVNGVDYVYTDQAENIIGDGKFPATGTVAAGSNYVDYYYKALSDGLIEGNETIIFKVNNSCLCSPTPSYLEKMVTIVDVPQIQTSSVSVIKCSTSGYPVATITVNLDGGLDPTEYLYSLDGGTFQASNQFTIPSAVADGSDIFGTSHTVTVKDFYSCNSVTENNIIIPDISPFAAEAGSNIEMCAGQTGVQLNASGGIYYSWTSDTGLVYLSNPSIANPAVRSDIPVGTYIFTVTAQDQEGLAPTCSGTDNMTLTVKPRPALTVTSNSYSVCNGMPIQLTATETNGVAISSWFWNPETNLSSPTISNPVYTPVVSSYLAQSFSVTATATNGCTVSGYSAVVEAFPAPVITTGAIVNAGCGLSNGSATVSATSPGTLPPPTFTYLWNTSPAKTTASATGLAAGTYTVTVTDATHGCSSSKSVTVGTLADVTPPTTGCKIPFTVYLDGTGNAAITVSQINNPAVTADNCTATGNLVMSLSKSTFNASNLGANTVTLSVMDASGNVGTCTTVVTVAYPTTCIITGSRTIYKESFDAGSVNGGYSISAGSAYNINSSAMRVTKNTTVDNFFISRFINVLSYTHLNISVSTPATQTGLNSSDYIQFWYSVDGGANYVQFANNGRMTGTTTGTACSNIPNAESVRIKILSYQNGNSEWRDFDDVHLTGDPALQIAATLTHVTCYGQSNGQIVASATGGASSSYQYKLNAVPYTAYQVSGTFTGLSAGTYIITSKDANNVENTKEVIITQPANPANSAGLAVSDASVCNPSAGNVVFTITNALSGVNYELKTLADVSLSPAVTGTGSGTNLALTILQANLPTSTTTYKVVASTASGCQTTDLTDRPTLNITPKPAGSASQSFCSTNSHKISDLSVTGTGIIWYNASTGGSVLAPATNLVNGLTYYASQTIGGCESATRLAVTASVTLPPTILSVTHGAICGSGTVTLQATASAGVINWYSGQTGGASIGTGTSFTTPNISSTTSYWVESTNNGCATSPRSQVIANVYALPTISLGANPAVCIGAGSAGLTYSATTGGANQYSINFDATAEAAGFIDLAFRTLPVSPIAVVVPGTATVGTYKATLMVKNSLNSCASTPDSITFTINPTTAITSQSMGAQETCIGQSFSPISVSAVGVGLTYQWYSDVSGSTSGGTSLGSANGAQTATYTPQATQAGTLFYYCTVIGTCGSAISSISGAFVVNAIPTATISYLGSPFCKSVSVPQSVSLSGTGAYSGGIYSSTTGLTINPSNGEIAPATSIAGVYTVTYTIPASGGCSEETATTSVTITQVPVATFNYSPEPYCSNASNPLPVFTGGGTAGTFSSATGLIFVSTSTGEVNLSASTPGTYTVINTIAPSGGCDEVSATATITITALPTAAISYIGTPFCKSSEPVSVTLNGTAGGVYSSTAGLTIDSGTGAITPASSTGGTYTVTYTIAAAAGCQSVTATTSVIITAIPVGGFSYTGTPYCINGTNPSPTFVQGGVAGTFSSTAGLVFVSNLTGQVNLSASTPGSYTVTNTIAGNGGCGVVTATSSITISAIPAATISYSGAPFCKNILIPQQVTRTGTAGGTYSALPAGLTIDLNTGAIVPSTSTAGTYTVTYTMLAGGCAPVLSTTSVTINSELTAGISGGTTPVCYNSSPGTLTATGSGGTGSYTYLWYKDGITTGVTTQTYSPGNLIQTSVFYCAITSGSCGTVNTPTSTITVTEVPTGTISYAGSPFCIDLSAEQPVTLSGTGAYTGGTYSSSAGLSINTVTGAITPNLSTAGSYTVTYIIPASGGCSNVPVTTSVTITLVPSVTLTYAGSPFCMSDNSSQPVTLTNGIGAYTGGTYSSTEGLSINAATGEIIPGSSIAGTYTVSYSIPESGGCGGVVVTTSVTITAVPTVAISYSGAPFCKSQVTPQAVTLSGTGAYEGGTYTASPSGLSINSGSGDITPVTSTPGSYTVTYTTPASGGCSAVVATLEVAITPIPTATISYSGTPFCKSVNTPQAATLSGTGAYEGGTYTAMPAGLSINSSTGDITPGTSEPGTYTVTYTIPASGGCSSVTTTSTVIITAVPTASIVYGGSPFCNTLVTPQQVTLTGTGAYTGGTYTVSPVGLTINALTGDILPASSTAGAYTVTYTVPASGGCDPVGVTLVVTLTALPVGTFTYTNSPYCANSVNPLPTFSGGGVAGVFSSTSGLIFVSNTTGEVNLSASTPGTYMVTNTIAAAGGCAQVTETASITITELPTAVISYPDEAYCKSVVTAQSISLSGTAAYTGGVFSAAPAGLSINAVTGAITPGSSSAGTYTVSYAIPSAGGCTPEAVTTSVTITAIPYAEIFYTGSPFCWWLTDPQIVTFTGTSGGTYTASPAGLSINPTSGAIIPNASTTGTYTVTYTVAPAGGCDLFSTTTSVTIIDDLVWTGNMSTDWNVPANWSCLVVPDINTNVRIPLLANQPVLSNGTGFIPVTGAAKNIVLENGSSLTVTGNTIQIGGTISNSGTFTATEGTVEMKGNSAQIIGADVFATNTIMNLTINNSNSVVLEGTLNITGILNAAIGNLAAGDFLTLISTATQTALIDGTGTGEVLGNVTMQRYLPSTFGYKYFSSPFRAATVNEFGDDMNLSAVFPTFYRYNENHFTPAGVEMSGWTTYTDPGGLLNPLEGYAVNFGPLSTPKTADITGTVTNGQVQVELLNHKRLYTKGFNLVGNPYPSPIDWNNEGWTKNNIDNALYFFNASNPTGDPLANDSIQYQGVYSSYVNGAATGNGSNIIASMQGFFVHVTEGPGTVTGTLGTTNPVRTNDLNPQFKKTYIDHREILRFTANFETTNAMEDMAVVYFDRNAKPAFDSDMDALKLTNTDPMVPNLYSFSLESRQLSINGLPILTDSITEIPLGLNLLNTGWVTFKAKDISQLPFNLHLYLLDGDLGIIQDLQRNPEYRFNLKNGEYNERFSLVFSLSEITDPAAVTENLFKVLRSGNLLIARVTLPYSTRGTLMVTNMAGQVVLRKEVLGSEMVEINPNSSAGIYIVTLVSGKRAQSEKLLMRLDYE